MHHFYTRLLCEVWPIREYVKELWPGMVLSGKIFTFYVYKP